MKLDPVGAGASHADTIIALWNLILYAGAIVACLICPLVGDRYGRRMVIGLGGVTSVVGAALQAGSVSPAMLIVARFIVGAGMGVLLATVPLYQTEISPPSNRGLIVGLHGTSSCTDHPGVQMLTVDCSFSDWIWLDDCILDRRWILQCWWSGTLSHVHA